MGHAWRHVNGHGICDYMLLHLIAEAHFDFSSEIADIVRITPEEAKNLVEIMFMRRFTTYVGNRR